MDRWLWLGMAPLVLACGSGEAPASAGSDGGDGGARPADPAGLTADGGTNPPNAGPGGDTSRIVCGTTTCPIPGETCCVSELGTGNSFACSATPECPKPPGGRALAALKCSSAVNCAAGNACCIRETPAGAASECKPTCGDDEAQLCDLNAPAGSGCPPRARCSSDNISAWGQLPRTYATCGGDGS